MFNHMKKSDKLVIGAVYKTNKNKYFLYMGKTQDNKFLWIYIGNPSYYVDGPEKWIDYLLQIPISLKDHIDKTKTIKKNIELIMDSVGLINMSRLSNDSKQVLRFHGLYIA